MNGTENEPYRRGNTKPWWHPTNGQPCNLTDMQDKYCIGCYKIPSIQTENKGNHKSEGAADDRATSLMKAADGRCLCVTRPEQQGTLGRAQAPMSNKLSRRRPQPRIFTLGVQYSNHSTATHDNGIREHIKATSKRHQTTPKRHQSDIKATSKRHQSDIKATSK